MNRSARIDHQTWLNNHYADFKGRFLTKPNSSERPTTRGNHHRRVSGFRTIITTLEIIKFCCQHFMNCLSSVDEELWISSESSLHSCDCLSLIPIQIIAIVLECLLVPRTSLNNSAWIFLRFVLERSAFRRHLFESLWEQVRVPRGRPDPMQIHLILPTFFSAYLQQGAVYVLI